MRFAKLAQVGRLNPTRVWRLSEAEWAALQDRLSSAVTAAPGGPGVAPEDEEWGAALLEERPRPSSSRRIRPLPRTVRRAAAAAPGMPWCGSPRTTFASIALMAQGVRYAVLAQVSSLEATPAFRYSGLGRCKLASRSGSRRQSSREGLALDGSRGGL